MRCTMRIAAFFAPALVVAVAVACAGTPVRPPVPLGDVDVVLRRIDIVKGGYDQLEVQVVLAIGNGTATDLDVAADLDIALVGQGSAEGDGDGGGAESGTDAETGSGDQAGDGSTGDGAPSDGEDPLVTPSNGLDGSRHAGRAGGTAPAQNTSELLVPVTLPLPSDADVLERVLGWPRARVHVRGKVRIGLLERTIAGERDLATPKLPELRLKNPQLARADDGAAGEAFITLLLDNKNTFAVTVDKLAWDIAIAGKTLRTKEDGSTQLQPSAVEEYNESIVIDASAFPAKELKALLKKPAVPYVITGSVEVRGIRRDFRFDGEMQFPR
jgi:LEA14-like dessication related protein